MTLKQCTKCKEWKAPDEFGKDRTGAGGLRSQCKRCRCETESKRNRAPRLNQGQHKPYKPAEMPDWLYEIKLEIKKLCRAEYRKARLDLWRKRYKEYRNRHAEKELERIRVKAHNRSEKIKANGGGTVTAAQWRELKAKYNYTCLKCRRTEPEIKLTLDHVKPVELGGNNAIDNIQPLCGSCNSSKGIKTTDYR